MANFRKTLPTTLLPTMGGLHLSEKGSLGVTLRYPDLQFYTLTPAGQAKGILPFVKNTLIMRFRCFKTANKQSCRAKANIEWLLEQKILDDFKDIEAILNPDNWRIREHPHTVHSCDSPVMPFHSDRQNFGNGYRNGFSSLKKLI